MSAPVPACLLLLASLSVEGAGAGPAPPLSESQIVAIRKDVGRVTRAWIQANERADAVAAMALYAATPDLPLMFADSEGRLMDFEGLHRAARESLDAATGYKLVVHQEATTVLDETTALWVFHGAFEGTLKTGARIKSDACAVTLLLRRLGPGWRIVFQHESFAPPATLAPAEPTEKGM